jgi:hypothetical protein
MKRLKGYLVEIGFVSIMMFLYFALAWIVSL